ncbi:MAG: type II secretion system F family protein [Synergistaceae bacterium]|nr:type II secretion system F family protein [Synergistaceae bacterium]
MQFIYRARDENGELLEGQIEAKDRRVALNVLREGGLIVLNMKPVEASGPDLEREPAAKEGSARRQGASARKGMVFFRQLATMVKAGLDLGMSLDVIAEQERNPAFRATLRDVKNRLNRGVPLSQAMRQHPFFNNLMISLVQAGEEGGMLDSTLDRVAILLERQTALRSKVLSALAYPFVVVLFALCVVTAFFTLVLPKFKTIFDSMHIELPWLTQALLSAGNACVENWKIVLPVVLAIVLIPLWLFTGRLFKPFMDRLKLKLPVFGGIVFKSSMAQATRTLAALTAAGVPILRSLEIAGNTADNAVVRKGFSALQDGARRGVSLGDAAKQAGIFPVLVSQMLRIGTETGKLDSMMERVASWYDQELNVQIKTMLSLLEPALIILVGGVVALIALCLLGPFTSAMSQMTF